MLFSATMPDDIVKLTDDVLRQPERIEVAPQGQDRRPGRAEDVSTCRRSRSASCSTSC